MQRPKTPLVRRSHTLLPIPKLDAVPTSAPTVGAVGNFGTMTSNAAGVAGDLAGTISTAGAMTITAGGAGTSAIGQFSSGFIIK